MNRYVAFDFELANANPTSICSIGYAVVENNKVVKTYYSLVRPVPFYMTSGCFKVHRIPLNSLSNERKFVDIWKEISEDFNDTIIISHDVYQDSRSLRAILNYYGLPYPDCRMSCSFILSKRLLPNLPSYKLADLSNYFHFVYQPHHALNDSLLCAALISKMEEIYQVDSLDALCKIAKFKYGRMKPGFYSNVYVSELVHENDYDMNHFAYEKNFCLDSYYSSYDDVIEFVRDHGGFIQHKVNASTNYLLTKRNGKSKNLKTAKMLEEQGQDIEIMNMARFKRKAKKVRS